MMSRGYCLVTVIVSTASLACGLVKVGPSSPNALGSSSRQDFRALPDDVFRHITVGKEDLPAEPLSPEDFERGETLTDGIHYPVNIKDDVLLSAGLFEGDIQLRPGDKHMFSDQPLMNAIMEDYLIWPNGVIPYVISSAFDNSERGIIARAFAGYHQHTCIRLVPRANEPDYIYLTKGSGCSSAVGRVGGQQVVSLGTGCVYEGIVMHELMHATGFWHEQSRPDRDNYITIIEHNIIQGMLYNFNKYDWNTVQNLSVPYDTGSIMHYGAYSFSKNGQKTIVANNNEGIGQRSAFSQKDTIKLRKLYKCDATTTYRPEPETTPAPQVCQDSSEHCGYWAGHGECEKNPSYMHNNCQKSCNKCKDATCKDDVSTCAGWVSAGYCGEYASYMHIHCKKSCGLCSSSNSVPGSCVDTNKYCADWAKDNQCRVNPSYMLNACKKSCNTC